MNEVILCKYGEVVLKGLNKRWFESMLVRELRSRMKKYGNFEVKSGQSVAYATPLDDECDFEGAYEEAKKIFGFVKISRALSVAKDMDAITEAVRDYVPQYLCGKKTFKVEGRRSDKRFPLNSMQLAVELGGVVLECCPGIKVDVHNPDVTVRVEIREDSAYIHALQEDGAGGMPVGSNGKALLMLSGGIDSPVAGYMMARRGVKIEALHFESFPYTSERAREKVLELANILTSYTGAMRVHVISLTHIQEELRDRCNEEYFTLLLRRFMMRLANMTAEKFGAQAHITGESLGQVASQTIMALGVTNPVADRPVFRPLIGMDKTDIIEISRKIDTFDTSIQPYEDCCTVFTPRHPKTRPDEAKVIAEEQKIDVEGLVREAFETLTDYYIGYDE